MNKEVYKFLEAHCSNLKSKYERAHSDFGCVDYKHWTTGGQPDVFHEKHIATGAFGEVHRVSSVYISGSPSNVDVQ